MTLNESGERDKLRCLRKRKPDKGFGLRTMSPALQTGDVPKPISSGNVTLADLKVRKIRAVSKQVYFDFKKRGARPPVVAWWCAPWSGCAGFPLCRWHRTVAQGPVEKASPQLVHVLIQTPHRRIIKESCTVR